MFRGTGGSWVYSESFRTVLETVCFYFFKFDIWRYFCLLFFCILVFGCFRDVIFWMMFLLISGLRVLSGMSMFAFFLYLFCLCIFLWWRRHDNNTTTLLWNTWSWSAAPPGDELPREDLPSLRYGSCNFEVFVNTWHFDGVLPTELNFPMKTNIPDLQ